MIDSELTNAFFLDSKSEQLRKIHQWARARRVAPWALAGAVLLRVSASTPYTVQLPGVIGGNVSLNAFCAFVSRSGGGKGISDKVARLAWPTNIEVRLPGSGEGISEPFVVRGKESEDNERLSAYILTANEIDTLTGLASRQGSILLAQLKSAWMGEPIGQSNASKATSRHVKEHDYRLCLSVGAQPGHAGVIFADTSGGSPQRFWWMPTEDPTMPRGGGDDPAPLNTARPEWIYQNGIAEIIYGIPEIEETIVEAHLARQRGETDALDGHALLSRCKVASLLAVMHQTQTVDKLHWDLSEIFMQVSDQTRNGLLEHDRQMAKAKMRERAIGRAVFDEIIDDRHTRTVRSRILRLLSNGPMSRSDLRRAMGKQHYREAFDALLPQLEKISQVVVVPGEKAPHYALNLEFTGEPEFTPENSRSDEVNHEFTGEPAFNVTDLDSRRSSDTGRPLVPCPRWLKLHIADLRNQGHTTTESFAVIQAGEALGYTKQAILQAAHNNPDIKVIARTQKTSTWSLTGDSGNYKPATEWVLDYFDTLPSNTIVDQDAFRAAAEDKGYTWTAARAAAYRSGRITMKNGEGWRTIGQIDQDGTAS